MKFAEKKRPPNPELLRWTFKFFFKNVTRQKGIHGGEVCNNATYVCVSWLCNSLVAGHNETRALSHLTSILPFLWLVTTSRTGHIWLQVLSVTFSGCLLTDHQPPSPPVKTARRAGDWRSPGLQTGSFPPNSLRSHTWMHDDVIHVLASSGFAFSCACVFASDKCLGITFCFWGHWLFAKLG